jgi:hypothetical protein
MAGGSLTKWTHELEVKFYEALCEMPNVSRACRICNVSRAAAYDRYKTDPAFKQLWDEGIEIGVDGLEEEAWRRSKGYEEPLHHQGLLTGETVTKFSTTLHVLLLKAHRPDKYRERSEVVVRTLDEALKEIP